jgi:hypothetical protein
LDDIGVLLISCVLQWAFPIPTSPVLKSDSIIYVLLIGWLVNFVLVGRQRIVLAYGNSVSISGVAKYQAALVWIKYSKHPIVPMSG